MTHRLAAFPPGEAARRRDELIALCAQAFCGAPWHEPPLRAVRTVERLLASAAGRPDFRAVAAFGPDGGLRGFAAGWTDTVLTGREPAFELAELVMAPAHQGLSGGSGSGRSRRLVRYVARRRSGSIAELSGRFGNAARCRARRRGPGHDPPDRPQGLGIGRALHDALLTGPASGPRLLMTLDVPELTERYERWGWTVAGRRAAGTPERAYAVMRRED